MHFANLTLLFVTSALISTCFALPVSSRPSRCGLSEREIELFRRGPGSDPPPPSTSGSKRKASTDPVDSGSSKRPRQSLAATPGRKPRNSEDNSETVSEAQVKQEQARQRRARKRMGAEPNTFWVHMPHSLKDDAKEFGDGRQEVTKWHKGVVRSYAKENAMEANSARLTQMASLGEDGLHLKAMLFTTPDRGTGAIKDLPDTYSIPNHLGQSEHTIYPNGNIPPPLEEKLRAKHKIPSHEPIPQAGPSNI